jgi:hypothetical protein
MINNFFNAFYTFAGDLSNKHNSSQIKYAKKYKSCKNINLEGVSGQSYVIPIRNHDGLLLSLIDIKKNVDKFLFFANKNKQIHFQIDKIGCDENEYTNEDIAPFFKNITTNCILPADWNTINKIQDKVCIFSNTSFDNEKILKAVIYFYTKNLKQFSIIHNNENITIQKITKEYYVEIIPTDYIHTTNTEISHLLNIEELSLYSNYVIILEDTPSLIFEKLKQNCIKNNKKYRVVDINKLLKKYK